MENREHKDTEKDRPSLEEILDFIEEWSFHPKDAVLKDNQLTTRKLVKVSGKSYSWAKKMLRSLYKEGHCSREKVMLNSGFVYVYTFETLPKF